MIQISLAAARINAGFRQEDVAKILKISKTTVCNWERGVCEPTITEFRKLSELYELPVDCIRIPYKSN